MKNWIDIEDNLKFAKISGDYNKIHIEKKYAKNFFFKYSKEYKLTKYLGEKLCKTKKSKKIIPISYRIDQIKSPQNYNIAGFYEGSSTRTLKKYIDDFLLKSQI